MTDTLTTLDKPGLLAEASRVVRERRLGEVRDLEVLSQWATVHSADPTEGPDGAQARRLGDVLVHPGGEGTPGVQDFCLGEIAMARGTGVTATINALADVLDLEHRLPKTWAVIRTGAPRSSSRVVSPDSRVTSGPIGSASSTPPPPGSSPTRPAAACSPWPRQRSSRPTPSSMTSASRPSVPGVTSARVGWTSSVSAP